jgi:zinc/manganese transport system substrate-binding protein
VCTGADLEVGWLPLVLTQAGNPKIRVGQPGYFEASRHVTMLEVPTALDRSQGDVHPGGNPHIHLDPRNIAKIAGAWASVMAQSIRRMPNVPRAYHRVSRTLGTGNRALGEGRRAAQRHGHRRLSQESVVPEQWLGMREVGNLEPKRDCRPRLRT